MTGQVFHYRAYGLSIRSELELPEAAAETAGTSDVDMRLRPVAPPRVQPEDQAFFEFLPDRQLLYWRRVGSFLIRGAKKIDIDPAPGVGDEIVRLPLLGPVMALLLHQRGSLVLHASAVALGARGAIFLGDKLAGKSTTAAALVGRGHRLLTDDVLAIDFPAGGPQIAPGLPSMKLDAGSGEKFFGRNVVAGSEAIPGSDKRRLQLAGAFSHESVAPGCIYVLARGAAARVSLLPQREAFAALMRFSYVARFGKGAMGARAATAHLGQCAALVRASRVCRLEVPHDLDRLGDALDLIETISHDRAASPDAP